MKIIKPLTLGMLHRTYRHRGTTHLVACVLGFFELGRPAGNRLLPEAPQWLRVMKWLPAAQPLDEVMPKACGETLVLGDACAPGVAAVARMSVRLSLGDRVDKRIVVVGDRQWRRALMPLVEVDEPAAFRRMPLDWSRAFGGPGCADNPLGRGDVRYRPTPLVGETEGPMPNLEPPDAPVRPLERGQFPAGFGPLPIDWPVRRRHAGTYDEHWLRHDHPGLPSDVRWQLYNQAPEDQRIDGWLVGGMPYALEGMSLQSSRLAGALPNHRVRAFARGVDGQPALREFPLHMDTAWFLPTEGLGVAVWRGELPVSDVDAHDVQALMSAYEPGEAPARPLAHYAQVLTLRLDPRTAPLHAFNEAQLAPELPTVAMPAVSSSAASRATRRIEALRHGLVERHGIDIPAGPPAPPPSPPLLRMPDEATIAAGDIDLTDLMQQVDELQARVCAQASALQADARQQLAELAPAGASRSASPLDDWAAVLVRASMTDGAHPDCDTAAETIARPDPPSREQALRYPARLACPTPLAPASRLSPDVAARLGRQVLDWLRAGIPLAGRDLAGADLHDVNLSGRDLSRCMLEHADLSGADLRGARLEGAVLNSANLSRARLARADLTNANLCRTLGEGMDLEQATLAGARAFDAHWSGARGRGADLSRVVFQQAVLRDACFDEAVLESALLSQVDLVGSRWRGALARRCVVLKAKASGADLCASSWTRSAWLDCDLADSLWSQSSLVRFQSGRCDWRRARLDGVRAERSNWHAAALQGADFTGAFLTACDLGEADCADAVFDDACLARSILSGARLTNVSARRADFFRALVRRTDCSGADLSGASLYRADLTGTNLSGACTHGLRLGERRSLA